ncbi:MAG TPA: TIM barrel protein [Bryobacteraceae bacterium]|jgi:sugar phosphate isomerase/epimerase
MLSQSTRRSFLAGSGTAVVAASQISDRGGPIRFGGPIFLKSDDPEELAREHRRLGYSAAYCPQASVSETDRVRVIEKAFSDAKVVIAEVGAWKNMLDPDSAKSAANLAYVTERCALAEEVGARCCVDIAGSYNPTVWYGPNPKNLSPEFFDATVENCRHILDTVKPKRTKFTIEMMGWNIPDGPDSYLRLIRAVDRPRFGVHMDVCNGVNCPARFYGNSEFIGECFSKLGLWITSCHAKDLQWIVELNVHFLEVVPGRGQMDYGRYLGELSKLRDVPLMMEHLKTAEEYQEAAQYIRGVGAQKGLSFI